MPEAWEPFIALAAVAVLFAGFLWEKFPPDVVALTGVAALLALGVLDTPDFIASFANGAAVAIGALFILSGALVRTGALERVSELVSTGARTAPLPTLALATAAVLLASAFMNNTPVVMVMIPVALQFASASGWPASRLLIPLSYAAILGGGCTLIGTSTNLLVDEVAQQQGMAPFSLFEITPVGLGVALVGVTFMAVSARTLLPDRPTLAEFTNTRREQRFFTEVVIPVGSPLEGQRPKDVDIFKRGGGKVVDVLRGDASLRRDFSEVTLRAGDRVVLRTAAQEVVGLRDGGLSVAGTVDPVSSFNTTTKEALIGPGSRLVGRILGKLRLRRRYGVYPLAVHRRGETAGAQLDVIRLQVGDTLLLEGDPNDLQRFMDEVDLIDLARGDGEQPLRRSKAPLAVGALLGVVLLSALGVMPIAAAAVLGVVTVLLARVLDPDEAFGFVDGRLLLLIVSMLAIGRALEAAGAVAMIVEGVSPFLAAAPPLIVLLVVFIMTSVLTEAVTNNVVAVVITPVAIGLAATLGYDARAFVVAVMIGANASFATPISYQTNMLVYAPGGYKFIDYLKLGVPLKLITGIAAVGLINFFWPL